MIEYQIGDTVIITSAKNPSYIGQKSKVYAHDTTLLKSGETLYKVKLKSKECYWEMLYFTADGLRKATPLDDLL
jgi:hypothetical protein